MQSDYDIAIIGGGLAGLCLAVQCAGAGYKTILFEKETYPFHKVCGEYISNESYDFLQRLGIPLDAWQLPSINELLISDAKGKAYHFKLSLGGFGISRYKLDNTLYQLALQRKVEVITNCKVNDVQYNNDYFSINTSAGTTHATVVSCCYGKRSNLDVKLQRSFVKEKPNKLNNYIGIKYHVKYPQPKKLIALHNFKNGYCGISNIEDDVCCLCYLTTAANLVNSGNSIAAMEKNILYQNPALKKIFDESEFLYKQPLTISQVSFSKKAQIENHILMIGDAAGMITPLCGNGMSMAMRGSKLAFESIQQFLDGTINRLQLETFYITQWQKLFSMRLQTGRMVQSLFGGNTSTSLFLKTISHVPFIANKIIEATHGKAF